jgi:hypothetical protein
VSACGALVIQNFVQDEPVALLVGAELHGDDV